MFKLSHTVSAWQRELNSELLTKQGVTNVGNLPRPCVIHEALVVKHIKEIFPKLVHYYSIYTVQLLHCPWWGSSSQQIKTSSCELGYEDSLLCARVGQILASR